jgi:hypothetical protein
MTTAPMAKHPRQPIVLDARGVARFKSNPLVRHLLDHGGIDMNDLAAVECSSDDRTQFAQLIGYSVSGAGDLHYFDREALEEADAHVQALLQHGRPIPKLRLLTTVQPEARCRTCRHWQEGTSGFLEPRSTAGMCVVETQAVAFDPHYASMSTSADFGCVLWEGK